MNHSKFILLPGLENQLSFLKNRLNLAGTKVLIMGPGTAEIAKRMLKDANEVEIIVEEYESMLSLNMQLDDKVQIPVKIMDFERTDYNNNSFDIVFAQASVSDIRRNKIVKEVKRLTKPDGYFCVGEIVKFEENTPNFINDLFDYSKLFPLVDGELEEYYKFRKWEIVDSIDLSKTLTRFYNENLALLKENLKKLSPQEKSYYKKILNQISHESNVYLKLGGDKFFGFRSLILKNIK